MDGNGLPATGLTDDDGVFNLGTHTRFEGAYPGDYRVTVTPPIPVPKVQNNGDWRDALGQYAAAAAELRKNPPKPLPFPDAVKDPNRTPLRQRVPPEGLVTIELQSSGAQPTRIRAQRSTGFDPYQQKPPGRR